MLFLFGTLSLIVQICCVVHAVKSGRDQIWIWVIMIGSLLGCTAYFAFELMPEIFGPGSRFARKARDRVQADPVAALQSAEAAVARADTAAARSELGEAYMQAGAPREAALQFQIALDRYNPNDPALLIRLAIAQFESGDAAATLVTLDRIAEPGSIGEKDRLGLLRARALVETARKEEAATLYADIVARLPGDEASCHYAAVLLDLGRNADARTVLEAVEKRNASRPSAHSDPEMIDWARQTLRGLRASG
jgi:hypothetical protein